MIFFIFFIHSFSLLKFTSDCKKSYNLLIDQSNDDTREDEYCLTKPVVVTPFDAVLVFIGLEDVVSSFHCRVENALIRFDVSVVGWAIPWFFEYLLVVGKIEGLVFIKLNGRVELVFFAVATHFSKLFWRRKSCIQMCF